MSSLRIAICDDYEGIGLGGADWSDVRARAEVVVFDRPLGGIEAAAAALRDFDAICLMRERMAFPAELLERLPRLRFIVFTGQRNAAVDAASGGRRGVVVSNTPGGPVKASTAEQAWALILAGAKRLAAADAGLRTGYWRADARGAPYPLPFCLEGERLGVVGLGAIGERVARAGQAFGMEVLAWSTNLTPARAAEVGARLVSREELFRSSRVVSLHLVLSERTRGIVGAADLALMAPNSLLVNTSRDGLIAPGALVAALRAGRPGHAALDVFHAEPLPAEDALLALPNVTFSPHLGYVAEPVFRAFHEGMREAVSAWLDGAPIRVVNAKELAGARRDGLSPPAPRG